MLTRDDQTVEDCLDVVEIAHEAGVQHVGFKDVGVERSMLAALNELIKRSNAVSYMEIVSTTSEAMIESARFAAGIGVDQLLGGQAVEDVLDVLDGTGIGYYPFPGRPRNHPTRLGGTPDEHRLRLQQIRGARLPGRRLARLSGSRGRTAGARPCRAARPNRDSSGRRQHRIARSGVGAGER